MTACRDWMRSQGNVGALVTLAFVSLLAASAGQAQPATDAVSLPAPSAALSLADAQRIAFERNWDLLAAASQVDGATAQKLIAHEFPNPSFSIYTADYNVDQHPSSTSAGNGLWDRSYDTIFAINQLFEIGGKRRKRQLSAQANLEGAQARLFDAKRTLDLAVAHAYAAAALAGENVRVLNESAATLRQEAKIAAVRLQAGDISASDKSQIEIQAEQFALSAQTAESAAAQARVALEVLLGLPHPRGTSVLSDKLDALCAAVPSAETDAIGVGRPDIVAAEADLRKAEADLRLQRAYRVPDPTVLAQYEHHPPDTPTTVGWGVSFPLPLWNHNKGNIRVAQAARDQAKLALEKAKAQAVADIATARLAYDDAVNRWRNYRDQIGPKSARVRQTVAYAYEKGGASLLDLLQAERTDNDIRLAAAQAASDTAVAGAALKAALAVMPSAEAKK